MEAGILPMQYEFFIVFIWGKSSYNLFQLTVYTGNLFATSKWNGDVTVHKNCSYDIVLIMSVTIYHVHTGMNLVIVCEKQTTDNITHLLVKQNENFLKKWIWLVVALFTLRFPVIFHFNVQKTNII